MSQLQVKQLSMKYANAQVLDAIDFSLSSGEIVCLVGESGSGKSTIFHSIMGTLPGYAQVTAGSIELDGVDLTKAGKKELRSLRGEKISMIFQNSSIALCPVVKVRKHFKDMLKAHGAYDKSTFEKAVLDMFAKLGLKDGERILNAYPFELSGGMAQRVGIALACLLHPAFLLADEPTSALDVTTQKQVINEIKRMRDEFGVGVLLVTHSMGVVSHMADNVGVCYAGQLVEFGPLESVLSHPLHPYTKMLLQATPQINGDAPKGMEGRPPQFGEHIQGCRFRDRCPYAQDSCAQSLLRKGDNEHWSLCDKGGVLC